MSTNASTWFYQHPEALPYLITERLNGSFWAARIVDVYWKCQSATSPFEAVGYLGDEQVLLRWVPARWLRLAVPAGLDADRLVRAISSRVLAFPATATYVDPQGRRVYEWHTPAGADRWNELQGLPEFGELKRL